jgi:ERF superfamily.
MKNIAMKLVKVMEACRYIQKQGTNDYHKYRYATASDVLEKVNQAFVQQKLAIFAKPELLELQEVMNAKGNVEKLATVRTVVTIIDGDSGESAEFVGLGSGQDIGDKSVMKAQTASLKYAYMMTLAIATGDDPEADSSVDERMQEKKVSPPTPLRKTNILCTDCSTQITATMEKISMTHYQRPLCVSCQSKEKVKLQRVS